jgi:hypothetical protein
MAESGARRRPTSFLNRPVIEPGVVQIRIYLGCEMKMS